MRKVKNMNEEKTPDTLVTGTDPAAFGLGAGESVTQPEDGARAPQGAIWVDLETNTINKNKDAWGPGAKPVLYKQSSLSMDEKGKITGEAWA